MLFTYPKFQKSPYCGRGKCGTTVTGIAKGHNVVWNKRNSIKGIGVGAGPMLYFINIYPLVMTFNVQRNAVFIPKFSEISLP